jgi:hypothetical protein
MQHQRAGVAEPEGSFRMDRQGSSKAGISPAAFLLHQSRRERRRPDGEDPAREASVEKILFWNQKSRKKYSLEKTIGN